MSNSNCRRNCPWNHRGRNHRGRVQREALELGHGVLCMKHTNMEGGTCRYARDLLSLIERYLNVELTLKYVFCGAVRCDESVLIGFARRRTTRIPNTPHEGANKLPDGSTWIANPRKRNTVTSWLHEVWHLPFRCFRS